MMCIAMYACGLWGGGEGGWGKNEYTSVIILTNKYIWKYFCNSLILLINNMCEIFIKHKQKVRTSTIVC